MKITGEHRIPADRQTVWKALNDPEILKACLPGCEEINKSSDTEMTAKLTARVGPVRAHFTGAVTLSDLDPPNGYTLTGEGQGGAAGFASGTAKVRLSDDPVGTLLQYEAEARVGGKLAQIGSRLIDSTARKLSEEFFGAFAEKVGGGPVASPESDDSGRGEGTERAASKPGAGARKSVPTAVWVGGLVVIAVVLILIFSL
jgi:hypothetical protein